MPSTTTATELIFEDPPPARRRGLTSPVVPWLEALRQHPGKWAKYPEPFMSSGAAANIVRAKGYGLTTPGEYDAVMRPTTNKRYELYARYIGDDQPTT